MTRSRRIFPVLPLLAGLCASVVPVAAEHPTDGPDVDLRITIDDDEVVLGAIVNLAFLDHVADVPREDPDYIDPVEEPMVEEELLAFLRDVNSVTIDGVEVAPVLRSFAVLEPEMDFLPLFPAYGMQALRKVQMVLDYPLLSAPTRVSIVWRGYPPDPILSLPGHEVPMEVRALLTAHGVDSEVVFREAEPEFTWHDTGETVEGRFLPVPEAVTPERVEVPVLSLVVVGGFGVAAVGLLAFGGGWSRWRKPIVAGAPLALVVALLAHRTGTIAIDDPSGAAALPTSEEALGIFRPLHQNIYRAFDYTDEGDVYDALARSVDGDLLDTLYNEIYRSLIMQDEGGAVSRVQRVTPLDETVESIGVIPGFNVVGFQVTLRWQVDGTVFHWGHTHSRTNEYLARYTVLGGEEGWRIAESRILEQFRVDAAPLPPGRGDGV